jgi:hypothetical protein
MIESQGKELNTKNQVLTQKNSQLIALNLKLTERVIVREVDGVMPVEAVPEPDQPDEFWASHQHG